MSLPEIVFISGWGAGKEVWNPVLAHLGPELRYRCVAWQRCLKGNASGQHGPTVPAQRGQATALIDSHDRDHVWPFADVAQPPGQPVRCAINCVQQLDVASGQLSGDRLQRPATQVAQFRHRIR